MKVAISSTGKKIESDVDSRFGRCPYFLIVEIENRKIKNVKAIENTSAEQTGGAGITAAQIVAEQDVEAVITANMGPRAFDVFKQLNIKVYQAVPSKVENNVQQFIDGKLKEVSNATGPQHIGLGR